MKINFELHIEKSAKTRVFLDDVEVSNALTSVSAQANLDTAHVMLTQHRIGDNCHLSDQQREVLERFENLPEPPLPPLLQMSESLRLGIARRECQRIYFLTRNREDLIASKQAESKFDAAAKQLLEGLLA